MSKLLTDTVKCSKIIKTVHPVTLTENCVTFNSGESSNNVGINIDISGYGNRVKFFKNYTAEIYLFRFGEDTIPEDIMIGTKNDEYDNFTGRIFGISEEKYGNIQINITHFGAHYAGEDKDFTVPEIEWTNILNIPAELLKAHYPEIRIGDFLILRIKMN